MEEVETWFIIIVTLCLTLLLTKAIIEVLFIKSPPQTKKNSSASLPPQGPLISPYRVPVLSALVFLRKSNPDLESTLRSLRTKWGVNGSIIPLPPAAITIRFLTTRPLIFVFSRSLAHKLLIDNGVIFADRPVPVPTARIMSSNQHNITSAGYGDTWRILRRNLTSQILHPSKLKSYSNPRSWVVEILINRLMTESSQSTTGVVIKVVDHFRYAMFCLLVLMCFGDKFEEDEIRRVESVQHELLVSVRRFQLLNLRPVWLSKLVFRGRWDEFYEMKQRVESVIIPFIRRRRRGGIGGDDSVFSYVDSLLELEVPDDDDATEKNVNGNIMSKRKLTEPELVSICSEFLNAGTDTTTTALEWIMANLVKTPEIQSKLYEEIKGVCTCNNAGEMVEEEDLSKLLYLKAVVLEGLRRHPPAHFVLPHGVTQDVEVDGYLFPKNSRINFMVADIGRDSHVWDDPMEFRPERFIPYLLGENRSTGFDITGSKGDIKMMPFGVGRRICPAFNLAIMHLEYFVANLIRRFEWRVADGYEVDLSEKQEFTTVMKFPLRAQIVPRGGYVAAIAI